MNTITKNQKFVIERSLELVHPDAMAAFSELAERLERDHATQVTRTRFKVFETFRNPQRQLYLLNEGASKAGPYRSAHNYGLAVDFVPWALIDDRFSWSWDQEHDWAHLKKTARIFGLDVPISWDLGHVQHPLWHKIREAYAR